MRTFTRNQAGSAQSKSQNQDHELGTNNCSFTVNGANQANLRLMLGHSFQAANKNNR